LDAVHTRKGNVRLLPSHLLKIRDHCLAMALCKGGAIGIYFIMLWCMILVGTFLFLRSSELLALKLEDFKKEGCLIKRDSVRTLCVKLPRGKRDNKPVYFKLFKCDKMPEFCPVRIVLFFVDLAGLDCEEGYLFPTRDHLIAIIRGEMLHKDAQPMSYENWKVEILNLIKACCAELLDRQCSRVGTHILRYCGYTFATWGTINSLCSLKKLYSSIKGPEFLRSPKHASRLVVWKHNEGCTSQFKHGCHVLCRK
jgi:hypothetical protein